MLDIIGPHGPRLALNATGLVVNIFQIDLGPLLQSPDGLILLLSKFGGSYGGEHVPEGEKKFILNEVTPARIANLGCRPRFNLNVRCSGGCLIEIEGAPATDAT